MATSTASVPTSSASRYLQQLCKHWGHRFAATFDHTQGLVDFGGSTVRLRAEVADLVVTVAGPTDELPELERAVADHLNRFAHREGELAFDWHRED